MTQTTSERAISSGSPRRPRAPWWVGAVVIAVFIGGWLGYLRWVSGVLAHEEKYPNGKVKTVGFLKRTGWNDYKRHGLWTTYHRDGKIASKGKYEMGRRLEGWEHWDERGHPTTAPETNELDR